MRAICALLAVLALAAAPASAATFADFLQSNPLYEFISQGVPGAQREWGTRAPPHRRICST